jgi:hypothetical protein
MAIRFEDITNLETNTPDLYSGSPWYKYILDVKYFEKIRKIPENF